MIDDMKMVFKFVYFMVVALFFTVAAPSVCADAFYVWQQLWSSNVLSAVSVEAPTTLYPLACMIPANGKSRLFDIPWRRLPENKHQYIPVIRIPLKAFRRQDLSGELDRITQQLALKMAPHKLDSIQLDLDCPERLLDRYLELIRTFRQKHPDIGLSITALPSHLKHKTFHKIAASVDYYVLQVHGIEIPKNVETKAELLNLKTAKKALSQAEQLGLPYYVALPCYAYELNFELISGDFLFLTAEKQAKRLNTTKVRSAAGRSDLIELHKRIATLKNALGVIWFRLPVVGDRLCLPRKTLALIQDGILPKPKVECCVVNISNSTIELELHNSNIINSHQAVLKLQWPNPEGSWDTYSGIHHSQQVAGKLPVEIIVPMPSPGESHKIGWFQAGANNQPKIEVILK